MAKKSPSSKLIRIFIVIALVVLLCGAFFLHAGGPALPVQIFVFLFLLTLTNCLVNQPVAVLADHVEELAPARAPPIFS